MKSRAKIRKAKEVNRKQKLRVKYMNILSKTNICPWNYYNLEKNLSLVMSRLSLLNISALNLLLVDLKSSNTRISYYLGPHRKRFIDAVESTIVEKALLT